MGKEFQQKITTYLVRTGEMQHVMLSVVRAVLAIAIVGVTCYSEVVGKPASEPFYMLVGLVIGMYFEKGTALTSKAREAAPAPPAEAEGGSV
jgi:hypothetical protein